MKMKNNWITHTHIFHLLTLLHKSVRFQNIYHQWSDHWNFVDQFCWYRNNNNNGYLFMFKKMIIILVACIIFFTDFNQRRERWMNKNSYQSILIKNLLLTKLFWNVEQQKKNEMHEFFVDDGMCLWKKTNLKFFFNFLIKVKWLEVINFFDQENIDFQELFHFQNQNKIIKLKIFQIL